MFRRHFLGTSLLTAASAALASDLIPKNDQLTFPHSQSFVGKPEDFKDTPSYSTVCYDYYDFTKEVEHHLEYLEKNPRPMIYMTIFTDERLKCLQRHYSIKEIGDTWRVSIGCIKYSIKDHLNNIKPDFASLTYKENENYNVFVKYRPILGRYVLES